MTTTITITTTDVAFIGDQIIADLTQIQKAYPELLDAQKVLDANTWIKRFLWKNAISSIGISIYDPSDSNSVYDEWNYSIHYIEGIPAELVGKRTGEGGATVKRLNIPEAAELTFYVRWTENFKNKSEEEQRLVVSGTGWDIPGKNPTFKADYSKCKRGDAGWYVNGGLGAHLERITRE